jgi:hypothetical protein
MQQKVHHGFALLLTASDFALLCLADVAGQVSAASGRGVASLFTTLFGRALSTIPGVPQDLAAAAVQHANATRADEGIL